MMTDWKPGDRLVGDAARRLISDQIQQHSDGILSSLKKYEMRSAFLTWFETMRAVEEFINLPLFGLKDFPLAQALIELPLDVTSQPRRFRVVLQYIKYQFGDAFAVRFTRLISQAMAIGIAFAEHDIESTRNSFRTVGSAIDYFQSRRRHLVSLLYTLPSACHGDQIVPQIDTLNQFLPLVEMNGITITGLYQQAMLAEAFDDFAIRLRPNGFSGSYEYPMLDAMYLEPERTSIVDIQSLTPNILSNADLEEVSAGRLFSSAELRNDIRLMEAAYAEFDLAGSGFSFAATFVRHLADLAEDDYWVHLSRGEFNRLADVLRLPSSLRQALIHLPGDYVSNTNSYAPLIDFDGELRGSLTLLSRFLYYWRNVCLYKIRRYQIRSGFIFEKTVSQALDKQGFTITDIKRINRKEFDVVATRDGIIFNVQCKNNLIDVAKLESNVKLFARYNRARSASYERALEKELKREDLLKHALCLHRVENLVVSRFPVATNNPRIISHSRIATIGAIASELVA